MSATLKDVAQAAAASPVTVSRVFNNHPNVSEDMRQRVLKAAAQVGYIGSKGYISSLHRHLKMPEPAHTLKQVGFLFHLGKDTPASIPFLSSIILGVESEARQAQINVLCRSISGLVHAPDRLLKMLRQMDIDGILLIGPPDTKVITLIKSTHLPLVLVDTDVPNQPVDAVLSDYFGGAQEAVNYLIQAGHRRIVFLSSSAMDEIYTVELRLMGYRAALMKAGLPLDEELYALSNPSPINIHSSLSPEGGYKACKQLLARQIPFSALFCANDLMAAGALKALHEAGKKVPEDVSVIGFDDIEMAEHLIPALTTMRVNREAMGRAAMKALMARAAHPEDAQVTTVLKVEMIKRSSVAPPLARASAPSCDIIA
ncbi:MAG: LacI family DNA-binding transcriptional regulator [Ktedonobacteraceae bacterium]|nr:LacI family DNA-binding transcriptional regulator [Ktedonobacteraceae bacterium]